MPPKPALVANARLRKGMYNVERTIAKLDEQKKLTNAQLMSATDPKEALRLHNELSELAKQLSLAEERWCALLRRTGRVRLTH